ncbi:MAG: pyridoxal phosphate-dependent aminotransferase [Puniceicoccales bacterium]|jgi:aspartate/methionine/tyrosine aminotransferase|nr:pyridoxal phosphate-dependent aminotransferase [Puniceicoccales bacterium]
MFSSRFTWNLDTNALTQAVAGRRTAGLPVLDLTESNPARAGFAWPPEVLAAALSSADNTAYAPDPRGLPATRQAVSGYYRERGAAVSPEQIHLSASTSESYGWVLKLLTNPGDAVLTPAPSYPLLQFLAAMECVRAVPYPLRYDNGHWRVDAAALEAALTPRTRAIFCVSPNNPTGSVLDERDRAVLRDTARRHGLVLVVDEVFLDFPAQGEVARTWADEAETPLFVLSGLSKVALLPQLKLGWLVTTGPEAWRTEAIARLDFIADTYLPVNTPAQHAAGEVLARAGTLREALRRRTNANEQTLREWCSRSAHGVSLLARDAGWSAVLELPRGILEEAAVLDLARHAGVLVHPGYFYDMPDDGPPHWVISLIVPEPVLAAALPLLEAALRRH